MMLPVRIPNLLVVTMVCMLASNVSYLAFFPTSVTASANQNEQLARFSDTEDRERLLLIRQVKQLISDRNLTSAEEYSRQFIKKFPQDAFGHYQLGRVLFRQKKPDEAIKAYEQAISINSRYALAYNAIGEIHASQSRWDKAVDAYNQALKINPEYAQALANLALVQWEQGQQDDAIASLEKVVDLFKSQNQVDKAERIERILRDLKGNDRPVIS